ncbi:NADH-quinone oxidoreductase subunit C [Streptomyces filamentosus]|uniref:Dehydrogenase n=1 Tax=Streptomyces filamentosus TaxID=67294 RepID=A0A919BG18_STRFL|nr:NADH-quinone oxidoreductase subunit C [Streptomyces filamentosus]GHF89697.1 dehydrogenase [Streptomyces filamentosus]
MSADDLYATLPDAVTDVFGPEATAGHAYDLLTVDVPPAAWTDALRTARDTLGCTYFDWLSAVDEPGTGFLVCAHVAAVGDGAPRRLLLRTTVPHGAPSLPTAIPVYPGAAWHERETHEMFGVAFEGHPNLTPLLLPENFEGHPLRKDFVLAARVAKAWPGAKEPGESHDGGPKRRQMLPPGVPDPNEWGPLKGQLPPAPERPTRGAADRPRRTRTAAEGSAGQDAPAAPPRRTRSVSEGSASQTPPASPETPASPGTPEAAAASPRRTRSASQGSASQTAPETPASQEPPAPGARPPRRTRSASEGSASQTPPPPATPAAPEASAAPAAPRRMRSASQGSASQAAPDGGTPAAPAPPPRTRSSDAPWHHARPAFDETPEPAAPEDEPPADGPAPDAKPGTDPVPDAKPAAPEPGAEPDRDPGTHPGPDPDTHPDPAGGDPA